MNKMTGPTTGISHLFFRLALMMLTINIIGLAFAGSVAATGNYQQETHSEVISLISQGHNLLNSGQLDQAENLLTKAVQIDPSIVQGHFGLAVLRYRQSRFEDAITRFNQVLELDPQHLPTHHNLALVHTSQRHFDKAEEILKRALQLAPDNKDVLVALAKTYMQAGRHGAAAETYERAIVIVPNDANSHHNLGRALGQQGRTSEAILVYRRSLALQPDSPDINYSLGNALLQIGKINEAVVMLNKSISIKANFPPAHYSLAQAYQRMGLIDKADGEFEIFRSLNAGVDSRKELTRYEWIARENPDNAISQFNLGVAFTERGRHNDALAAYQKAVALDPEDSRANYHLALTWFELRKPRESETILKSLIDNEAYPLAQYYLGQAYLAQNKLLPAILALRRFIEIEPQHFAAHMSLATAYIHKDRLADAAEAFRVAAVIEPDNADPLYGLGQVLADQGKFNKAATEFDRAFTLQKAAFARAIVNNPRDADAHYRMGVAYARAGQFEEAIARFEESLEISPELESAHTGLNSVRRQMQTAPQ